jgi:hypothetical protein
MWMLAGWFKDSFESSEVSTGTVTKESLSNFGNASGASVSNRILSKGIYNK